MSQQIKKKFIADKAVDGDKIELEAGQALKQDGQELIKLDAEGKVQIATGEAAVKADFEQLQIQASSFIQEHRSYQHVKQEITLTQTEVDQGYLDFSKDGKTLVQDSMMSYIDRLAIHPELDFSIEDLGNNVYRFHFIKEMYNGVNATDIEGNAKAPSEEAPEAGDTIVLNFQIYDKITTIDELLIAIRDQYPEEQDSTNIVFDKIDFFQTIFPQDGLDGTFGDSAAIEDDYIVLGDRLGSNEQSVTTGKVFLFKINEQNQTVSLLDTFYSPRNHQNGQFGASVAINQGYIVVGAPQDEGTTGSINSAGSAYLYQINQQNGTVSFLDYLNSNNEDSNDRFGNKVAISGDYVLVSTVFDRGSNDNIVQAGEVYLFKIDKNINNATLTDVINSNNESPYDKFGFSMKIEGEYIVIGAPGDDGSLENLDDAGEVYVYKINTQNNSASLLKVLHPIKEGLIKNFGYSLDINENYIAVGAPGSYGQDSNTPYAGGAYLFELNKENDEITLLTKIETPQIYGSGTAFDVFTSAINNVGSTPNYTDNEGLVGGNFGSKVSLKNDYIAISAPYEDDESLDTGRMYLFRIENIRDEIKSIRLMYYTKPSDLGSNYTNSFFSFDKFLIMSEKYIITNTNYTDEQGQQGNVMVLYKLSSIV